MKRALEADSVVVEAWLSDVYPQIKARAAREHGLVLWQDGSGVRLQHLTPKAGYAPRGQRAPVLTAGKRIGANLISALANSGQLHFSLFEGRFTAQVFIDFLGAWSASTPRTSTSTGSSWKRLPQCWAKPRRPRPSTQRCAMVVDRAAREFEDLTPAALGEMRRQCSKPACRAFTVSRSGFRAESRTAPIRSV